MRPEAFDSVRISEPCGRARLCLRQHSHLSASVLRLGALCGIALTVLLPQLAILAAALSNADARAAAALHPFSSLAIALALVLSAAACLWPLARQIERFNARRAVLIGNKMVRGADLQLGRLTRWSAPLAAYTGLAHRVRTSLSGARHELMLVHADSARSVLLLTGEHISDSDIARHACLLGLPQIQAAPGFTTGLAPRPLAENPAIPAVLATEAVAA